MQIREQKLTAQNLLYKLMLGKPYLTLMREGKHHIMIRAESYHFIDNRIQYGSNDSVLEHEILTTNLSNIIGDLQKGMDSQTFTSFMRHLSTRRPGGT